LFQFTTNTDVAPNITDVEILDEMSQLAGDEKDSDKKFVTMLMRHVFDKDILGTSSMNGSKFKKPDGTYEVRYLDAEKLGYVYDQLVIRAEATGINSEARRKRADYGYFSHYVAHLANNEKTAYNNRMRRLAQEQRGMGNRQEAVAEIADEAD
jgi:hypothetical protein